MTFLIALLAKGAWRRWPSLLVYAISDISADCVLSVLHGHPKPYFYTYWSWYAADATLRFWVLADVLSSFPGASFIMPMLRTFMSVAGTILVAASLAFSLHVSANTAVAVRSSALAIDSAVLLAWGVFLACAMFSIVLFRLRWSRVGSLVAIGLVVRAGIGLLCADLKTRSPALASVSTHLQCLAAIIAFSYWSVAALTKDEWVALPNIPPRSELPTHVE